ncbi:TniQ family protein [Cytobacillus solani]|uniref:TniQ domain-containing protein n=1 Tax=Cytobacillus solani TaxID=1637975 RepID=A0A0Q3VJD1_9BACI|nr:TniQ family protein [Cytobacillus solani]KQL21234.1 hypothetical protein AN957_23485 [Cytobacillus solani]
MFPVNYNDFDLDDINIPPRSKLYNIEPIGLGTPNVESLTSYISRLAECHNLNIATLVCKTFTPYINTQSRKRDFIKGSIGPKTKYINGNSPISLEYVSALEALTTRNDLIYLTMNSWSGLFSNSVIGESRKWCPNCLEEAKNKENEIYEPLIWYIKDIKLCDKHQVNLEDSCPKCGRNLGFLHNNFFAGYCQYCLSWLGYESQNVTINNRKYQEFLLNSFKPLIANAIHLNNIPTNLRIGLILKKAIKDNNFKSISEFANFFGLEKVIMRKWINNKGKPSIDSLYKIFNKTNQSIYEMFGTSLIEQLDVNIEKPIIMKRRRLTRDEIENELMKEIKKNYYKSLHKLCDEKGFNIQTAKRNFPDLCEEINNAKLKQKRESNEREREKIKGFLLAALEMEHPQSLQQFSIEFGIPVLKIKKYFPELSRKLIERYGSYVTKMQKLKSENIKSEIREIVSDLHNVGVYPSDKAIRKKLSHPYCLVVPEYREVWKEQLVSLGYNKFKDVLTK